MSSKLSLHGQAQNEGIENPVTPADSISYLQAITNFPDLKKFIRERKMELLLPEERLNLHAALRQKVRALLRQYHREEGTEGAEGTEASVRALREKYAAQYCEFYDYKTSATFEAAWADPILSSPGNTMKFKQLGLLRTGDYLVERGQALNGAEDAEGMENVLQTSGCLFFDGTALKSIITATSTQVGSEYLQAAAKLFNNPEGNTAQWIRRTHPHFTFQAYSAGGDEIILFFKAKRPLTPEVLTEMVQRFQDEVRNSEELKHFVDFNDVGNLMRYGNLDEDDKLALAQLPPEDQRKALQHVRDRLPEHFTPHFSGGYALLGDALELALKHDHRLPRNTAQAFACLERVSACLVEASDARQREDKRQYKKSLRENDPQQWYFMIRTEEAEKYARQVLELEQQVADLKKSLAASQDAVGSLQQEVARLQQEIQRLNAVIDGFDAEEKVA